MVFYNRAKKKFQDGGFNVLTDNLKWVLLTSTHTPDIDVHEFYSSLTNELATANGYTAGGQALGTKTSTVDAANDKSVFDAADGSLTLSGPITYRYLVIYKDTGVAGTSPLMMIHDFGTNVTNITGVLDMVWDALGIFNFV